jgi:hypothetical protein
MSTLSHLSALTAGYFVLAKVTKAARSHHTAPTLRFGVPSLRSFPGLRAASDLLRKSTSRAFGYAEGCCTRALQTPTLSLLKSRS